MTYSCSAQIATANASKYLQQLCKHFAHKVSVDFTAEKGTAALPPGPAVLTADEASLSFHCTSDSEKGLEVMRSILEIHLRKFAWREELEIQWS